MQCVFAALLLFLTATGDGACTRGFFPGVNHMRYGIDLSSYDLFSSKSSGAPYPLIEFTCNRNQTQEVNGVLYDIPDAFPETISLIPGTVTAGGQFFSENTFSYHDQMAAHFSVKTFLGISSSSASFKAASSLLIKEERAVAAVTSTVSAFNPAFRPLWSPDRPRLYSDAQAYIDTYLIPCHTFNLTCVGHYNTFFKYYGTDFATESCQGGSVRFEYATSKSYVSAHGQAHVNGQGKVSFLIFLKAIGAFSGSVDVANQAWVAATVMSQYTLGGLGAPTPATYNDWAASVLSSPHTIPCGPGKPAMQLQSISTLLPPALTPAFEAARTNWYYHRFISDEVLPSLSLYEAMLQGFLAQGRECSDPSVYDCMTACQKRACSSPVASCCTSTCAGWKNATSHAVDKLNARIRQIHELRGNATELSLQPIMDGLRVIALGAQYTELSLAVQSPLTTLDGSYTYHQNLDKCTASVLITCKVTEICPNPTSTVLVARFVLPSKL